MNAQEDAESRLQRLKMETPEIEQHNNKLENTEQNVSNKQAAEVVADSEVSSIIKSTSYLFRLWDNACSFTALLHMYTVQVTDSGSWPV